MSRRAIVGGAVVVCLVALGAMALAGEAAPPASFDGLVKQVAAYKYGDSRKPLIDAEGLIRASFNNPEQRKPIIAKLTALVGSDATPDAKRWACTELSIIAGPEVVPVAAKLLPDPDLSHMARTVLERVPGPEARDALVAALGTLKEKLLIGVINTLGQRRDREAAPAVAKFLGDADPAVASAAATALGKMGGSDATSALAAAKAKAPAQVKPAVYNGYLRCADHLVAEGKKDDAVKIYKELTAADEPKLIRIAAIRGLVAAGSDEALPLVVAALQGDDAEMQAVATSFIREMKSDAAMKAFADLLPKLAPKVQALVLGALAETRAAAARPAVLEALKSQDESVRVAALKALATCGSAEDVPTLAKTAATGGNAEKGPASDSLARLSAQGVDDAILKLMDGADGALKATLVRTLGLRRSTAAIPAVLKAAEDADEAVRIEALKAMEALGDEKSVPDLVKLLVGAKTPNERGTAEKTVQTVCGKGKDPNARVEPILAAVGGAAGEVKCSLLRVLGRLGGAKSLEAIRTALKDQDAQIKDGAIRALAGWPDATVAPDLLDLAKSAPQPNQKIIALQNYIRVVGLPNNRPADATLKMYQDAMAIATRPDEKKQVLGGLREVKHIGALQMAEECVTDQALVNEASQAIVDVAKTVGGANNANKAAAVQALAKVTQECKNKNIQGEAAKRLKELGGGK
jgi:HEAT repeat protein